MTRQVTPRTELPSTRRSLPIALIRAREAVMHPIREMLAGTGLTEQQWRILRVLDEFGPLEATQLAGRAGLMAPSLTRIVHAMVGEKLLTRRVSQSDRRRQVISITARGTSILRENQKEAAEIAQGYRERLGNEDYEQLLTLLAQLADPQNPD